MNSLNRDKPVEKKWQLSRINQGYQMTRTNEDSIECRELNWIEKIIYYFKTR